MILNKMTYNKRKQSEKLLAGAPKFPQSAAL